MAGVREEMTRELIPGVFYWAIPTLDPEAEEHWESHEQPARFVGYSKDGAERWQCIGVDGVSDWPMLWVGSQLTPPFSKG